MLLVLAAPLLMAVMVATEGTRHLVLWLLGMEALVGGREKEPISQVVWAQVGMIPMAVRYTLEMLWA